GPPAVPFFFQAEDGIRDFHVTGVQTCALPISPSAARTSWREALPLPNTRVSALFSLRPACASAHCTVQVRLPTNRSLPTGLPVSAALAKSPSRSSRS